MRQSSQNVSGFLERKYGSKRWLKITVNEFEIAFKKNNIHQKLLDMAQNGYEWNYKLYKYCCHKDSTLYFFFESDDIKLKDVYTSLGDMYSAKSIAKFASRMSLGFSKSYPLNDIKIKCSSIRIIDDYRSHKSKCVMTDGCGHISVDLAKQIPLVAGGYLKHSNADKHAEYPLLIQCRVIYSHGLAKGVLIANPNIPDGQIHLRQSMIKIKNPKPKEMEHAIIEVINTSTIGHSSNLNASFNIILSQLVAQKHGDDSLFRKYIHSQLKSYFECLQEIIKNPRVAFKRLKHLLTKFEDNKRENYNGRDVEFDPFRDDYQMIMEMILAGQNMNDPFLRKKLQQIAKKSYSKLLYKSAVPIEQSTYLMGVADPLNVLEENEVFIVGHTKIVGDILISRNPCQHPGDIRKFTAVNNSELHDFVGYYNRQSSGGVFFSTKGDRAPADLLSNGDYDGDLFWICWDQELVKLMDENFGAAPVDFADAQKWNEKYNKDQNDNMKWRIVRKSPMEFGDQDMSNALMTHFLLSNINSMKMKRSSKIWRKCFELFGLFDDRTMIASQCYFVALDASKNGIKVTLPPMIEHMNENIFPYEQDFGKNLKKREQTQTLIIKQSNKILMYIYETVMRLRVEYMNFDPVGDYGHIDYKLDEHLGFKEEQNVKLLQKIKEFDKELRREFARLKQKYDAKRKDEELKNVQEQREIYLFKRKYREKFEQYCRNNNFCMEAFAQIQYDYSYNKGSYWIPWVLCGDVLNKIKANARCQEEKDKNSHLIMCPPKVFKDVLLRKR